MKLLANLELSMQIVRKGTRFFAQALDTESLNMVFESEHSTRTGAELALGDFVSLCLSKDRIKTK